VESAVTSPRPPTLRLTASVRVYGTQEGRVAGAFDSRRVEPWTDHLRLTCVGC